MSSTPQLHNRYVGSKKYINNEKQAFIKNILSLFKNESQSQKLTQKTLIHHINYFSLRS